MLPCALVQNECNILSYHLNSKVLSPFAQCLQVEIENESAQAVTFEFDIPLKCLYHWAEV